MINMFNLEKSQRLQKIFNSTPTNYTKKDGIITIIPKDGYTVYLEKNKIVYSADGATKYPSIPVKNAQHLIALSINANNHRIIYHDNGALWVWNPKKNKPEFLFKFASENINCLIPLDGKAEIVVATTDANAKIYIFDVYTKRYYLLTDNATVTSCFHCNEENLNQLITTDLLGKIAVWDINKSRNRKIQSKSRVFIDCFASDMLNLGTKGKVVVSIHKNNKIVLWILNENKWEIDERYEFKPFDTRGPALSVCVVDNQYIVTGHEGYIIVRHIFDKSGQMQKLELPLSTRMSVERLIPVPGTGNFYSISRGEKKTTTFGCFHSNKTTTYRVCHLWIGPESNKNRTTIIDPEQLEEFEL